MKKLDLRQRTHQELLAQFERHLQVLNYSKDTVYNAANNIREYLFYLESERLDLQEVKALDIYFKHLKHRSNERRGGALSIGSLLKHRSSLRLFYDFLRISKGVGGVRFPSLPRAKSRPVVLSVEQVKQLFGRCDDSLLGKRNKALLALYYGLGLRRSEGVQLCMGDIDFDRSEVLIRKSKTRRQRIVPMSDHVRGILDDYLFNVREKLMPEEANHASVLVSETGMPLSRESVTYVVKKLVEQSKINTKASVHTLRHSIATHLLHSGMKLESIAQFLGHTSLDSTQLYTYLVDDQPLQTQSEKK